MSIRIQTNLASLGAQRNVGTATSGLQKSFDRLSSGLRINRAADDAAGLSIASSLSADTRIYTQAIRNVNDAVSLLNIAEGGISELSSVVTRQKELAEQAANGVYSSAQRVALNKEAYALTKEYNRIIRSISFNGLQIIDGTGDSMTIQQGIGIAEGTLVNMGQALGVAAGDGTFLAQQGYDGGNLASPEVVVVDFNNDNVADLLTSNLFSTTVSVLMGNGNGTFLARQSFNTGSAPYEATAGDFNGDGFMDIATSNSSSVAILLGNGDGTFRARQTYFSGTASPTTISASDMNGDGIVDLVASSQGTNSVQILIGNGDGTFRPRLSYGTAVTPYGSAVADLNGDGILDVVTANQGSNTLSVLLGNGDGTMRGPQLFTAGNSPFAVAVGDLNGDGVADLATGNNAGSLGILIGNGDGTFKAQVSYTAGSATDTVVLADFNGDGISDAAVGNYNSHTASVYIGNGDGTFRAQSSVSTGSNPTIISTSDFNGDGVIDMVSASASGMLNIVLGNADTTGRRNNLEEYYDISNIMSARAALSHFTRQLTRVGTELGRIGAYQSRLASSLNTMQLRTEGYATARSQIMDVDVAEESALLTRNQIIQRAGTAVLSQANLQPTLALRLLRSEPVNQR